MLMWMATNMSKGQTIEDPNHLCCKLMAEAYGKTWEVITQDLTRLYREMERTHHARYSDDED